MKKLVHFIWMDPEDESNRNKKELEKCLDAWKPFLDGYEVMIHTNDSLLDPRLRPQWEKYTTLIMRSDFLRYSILDRFGGWYFDVDTRPQKPLKEIEKLCFLNYPESHDKLLVSRMTKHGGMLNTDILYCEGGSQILNTIIEHQSKILKDKVSVVEFAGGMIRQLMRSNRDDFFIAPDEMAALGGALQHEKWILRDGERQVKNPLVNDQMYYNNAHGWPTKEELDEKKKIQQIEIDPDAEIECKHKDERGVCAIIKHQTNGIECEPSNLACATCKTTNTEETKEFNSVTTELALKGLQKLRPHAYEAALHRFGHMLPTTNIDAHVPRKTDLRLGSKGDMLQPNGPGTHLHKMLDRFGIRERDGCNCKAFATEMNLKGVEWCKNNVDKIVSWMKASAKDRKLPFLKPVARQFVLRAIELAEKESDMIETFDRVYCINLERRADRWESFTKQVPEDWPFAPIERVNAIDGQKVKPPEWWTMGGGAWGCFRSHYRLIENAINEGHNSILLLEDDAEFHKDFTEKVREFIGNLPDNWGMIYLGGQHLFVPQNPPKAVEGHPGIFRPYNVNRTHAFALRGPMLKKVYQHLMRLDWHKGNHVDHHLGRLHQRRADPIFCPGEWMVAQAEGKSNISGKRHVKRFWKHADVIDSTKPEEHPFLAILGLHSSGSSCIAGVCYHLGVDLGNKLIGFYGNDPDGKKCGFEAEGLAQLCERALPFPVTKPKQKRGEMWRALRGWINGRKRQAVENGKLAGGKYPQLSAFNNQLMNITGERLIVINCDRPIEDSIESMVKRKPKRKPEVVAKHQKYLEEKKNELIAKLPEERVFNVPYYELLADPVTWAKNIAEFLNKHTDAIGIPTSDQIEKITNWVQPDKRNV